MSIIQRRRRFTQAQRNQILKAYPHSSLTQREFAIQAGIGCSTLQRWLRNAASRSSASPTPFIEVPNPLNSARPGAPYRLHLAGGMQLEVGSGFRPEELDALLQVLRSL